MKETAKYRECVLAASARAVEKRGGDVIPRATPASPLNSPSLRELAARLEVNRVPAAKAIVELIERDRDKLLSDAAEILKEGGRTAGYQHLLPILIDTGVLPEALCDSGKFTLDEAVALVKEASRAVPSLDTKLAHWALGNLSRASRGAPGGTGAAQRILNILERTANGNRLAPMLVQFLRESTPDIRSKAALLMGKLSSNLDWALGDSDARVRANAIEAIWGIDSKRTRGLLWEMTRDSSNRVVGNALLALFRLGENTSIAAMLRMAAHVSPKFRATAAWAMGQTGERCVLPMLDTLQQDPDAGVRRNAALAAARISESGKPEFEAERLRVSITGRRPLRGRGSCLTAAIYSREGKELPDLSPAHIVVWENSRVVPSCRLRNCHPRVLAAGFAVPRLAADEWRQCIEQAILARLAAKRAADKWAILSYACPGNAALEPGGAAAHGRQECAFIPDAATLSRALRNPAGEAHLLDVLEALAAGAATVEGSRHVIVAGCADSDLEASERQAVRRQRMIQDAVLHATAFHAVAACPAPGEGAGMLAEVCRRTGGLFVRAAGPREISACCEKLYLSLLHRYEIEYDPGGGPAPESVRLQVFSGRGYGEDTLTL